MITTHRTMARPGYESIPDPNFPDAPLEWSRTDAESIAREAGIHLTEAHWQMICALQEFYARHEETGINARDLHDALDEHFHPEGGMKYLYTLFPTGPVAMGCRLAGLTPPMGAADSGFGSVM